MSIIHIIIWEPRQNKKRDLSFSDTAIVSEVIRNVRKQTNLPLRNVSGRLIKYHLSKVNGSYLDESRTLADNNVEDNETLILNVDNQEQSVLGIISHPTLKDHSDKVLVDGPSNLFVNKNSQHSPLDQNKEIRQLLDTLSNQMGILSQAVDQQTISITDLKKQIDHQNEIMDDIIRQTPIKPPSNDDAQETFTQPSPQINYLDFDLSFLPISVQESQYKIRASWSEGRQRFDGECSFNLPISRSELELDYLFNMGIDARRDTSRSPQKLAMKLGQMMFDCVFEGKVRDCFIRCQERSNETNHSGIRIRLHFDETPELINFPWEFFWNSEDDFLARNIYTPVVRYRQSPRPARSLPLKSHEPLKMLVFTANPHGDAILNIEFERANLNKALHWLVNAKLLEVQWVDHATKSELQRVLGFGQGPHIIHYIGHGGVDETKGGYLSLEGDKGSRSHLFGYDLQMMLRNCPNTQFVMLNSCRGGRTSADDPFSSIAMELTRAQVPATVAMQFEISDRAAINFSYSFYSCLAAGWSIYETIGKARQDLCLEGATVESLTPVLYSRSPDGIIFNRTKSHTNDYLPEEK